MRFVTWNVEWFNALFDDAGRLLDDNAWSARWQVTRRDQIAALGTVFRALDADAVMVIEAPDSSRSRDGMRALETFAARFGLRARRALIGFANDTQQEIALMYDPDAMQARHDPVGFPVGVRGAREVPRFDGVFRLDIDTDAAPETITWSKPPLEVAVTLTSGVALRLIGVHAKSKAPHGAKSPDDAMRIAIENRRKQLAQCIWLRARVETHLELGESLIVMGDFNDGPGLDVYERLFGRSGVEIVLGEGAAARLHDPHALARKRFSSARFWLRPQERWFEALLDFLMVSPDLAARDPIWRIWHPLRDPDLAGDKEMRQALLTASDHFPVSLDIGL